MLRSIPLHLNIKLKQCIFPRRNGRELVSVNIQKIFKSENPKISRIGRQKRKNNFFLFSPKEPICLTIFGNDIKRFDFLFLYSKFAKPENSATGPSTAAMSLEIWHMFNTLVRTHQTSSYHILYTVCGTSLKFYVGLTFVKKCFVLRNSQPSEAEPFTDLK